MRIPACVDGVLPPGETVTSVDEIEDSYFVTGRGLPRPEWDVDGRRELVQNLRKVVELFRRTEMVSSIFVDGSFVSWVDSPSDIDCYFKLRDIAYWDDGLLDGKLRELDPEGGWSWTELCTCGAKVRKPRFWCTYRIDLFPELGESSGIKGRDGSELTFAEAFRQRTDTGAAKGVLRIIL